jgi:hypothetical protein
VSYGVANEFGRFQGPPILVHFKFRFLFWNDETIKIETSASWPFSLAAPLAKVCHCTLWNNLSNEWRAIDRSLSLLTAIYVTLDYAIVEGLDLGTGQEAMQISRHSGSPFSDTPVLVQKEKYSTGDD